MHNVTQGILSGSGRTNIFEDLWVTDLNSTFDGVGRIQESVNRFLETKHNAVVMSDQILRNLALIRYSKVLYFGLAAAAILALLLAIIVSPSNCGCGNRRLYVSTLILSIFTLKIFPFSLRLFSRCNPIVEEVFSFAREDTKFVILDASITVISILGLFVLSFQSYRDSSRNTKLLESAFLLIWAVISIQLIISLVIMLFLLNLSLCTVFFLFYSLFCYLVGTVFLCCYLWVSKTSQKKNPVQLPSATAIDLEARNVPSTWL